MGILDAARELQNQKQFERLQSQANKQEHDKKKIKAGTYIGKDLNNGTDIIQRDGDEPINSYRLISNKSISSGDRVSLRPSQGGLQRADAKNVAPKITQEIELINPTAYLAYTSAYVFSGNNSQDFAKSFLGVTASSYAIGGVLKKNPLISLIYTKNGLILSRKNNFVLNETYSFPDAIGQSNNNINVANAAFSYAYDPAETQDSFTLSASEPLINLSPVPPFASLGITYIFPFPEFKNICKGINSGVFTLANSPIECRAISF